jgi:hypothetical protein
MIYKKAFVGSIGANVTPKFSTSSHPHRVVHPTASFDYPNLHRIARFSSHSCVPRVPIASSTVGNRVIH